MEISYDLIVQEQTVSFEIVLAKNGVDGAQGPQGLQGSQGVQGIQGEKGDTGEKGDKGDTGEVSTLQMEQYVEESINPKKQNGSFKLSSYPKGSVLAHCGDSNTVARPDYRTAYETDWLSKNGIFEGWTSYNMGSNGSTCDVWVERITTGNQNEQPTDNQPTDTASTNPWQIVNANPDVLILSLGTNDFRINFDVNTSVPKLRTDLKTLIDFYLKKTSAFIVLRMPPVIAYQNPDSYGFTDCIDEADAQLRSESLRTLYLEYNNYSDRISVIDLHKNLFGYKADTVSESQDPEGFGDLMDDTLHPSKLGYTRTVQVIAKTISKSLPYTTKVKTIGESTDADAIFKDAVWLTTLDCVAFGAGYLQFSRNPLEFMGSLSRTEKRSSLKNIPFVDSAVYHGNNVKYQEIQRIDYFYAYFHETGEITTLLKRGSVYDFPAIKLFQVNYSQGTITASTGAVTLFTKKTENSPYKYPTQSIIDLSFTGVQPLGVGATAMKVLNFDRGLAKFSNVYGTRDSGSGSCVVGLYLINQVDGRYVDASFTENYPGLKIGELTFNAGYRLSFNESAFVTDLTTFPDGVVNFNWKTDGRLVLVAQVISGVVGNAGNIIIKTNAF